MKRFVCLLLSLVATVPALAGIYGVPTVVSGDLLIVGGQALHLRGIAAPKPGLTCMAKDKAYPCGNVAKTALMDLVAGMKVTCTIRGESRGDIREADCRAGGFDLAGNMVHTGWALADRNAGTKFDEIERRAQAAKRGLWRGTFAIPGHPR